MQTIPESHATVQFDTALRTLAAQARTRYPGEAGRLDRGLCLALNGAVTLHEGGSADVQSASDPEIVYHVNGHCDCPDAQRAPEGRCKHRWAKCLVKKATAQGERYFATYYDPTGEGHQGIATRTGSGWLFVAEDGLDPFFAARASLVLGGNVAIYEAQREADGDLVRKVCGYAQV